MLASSSLGASSAMAAGRIGVISLGCAKNQVDTEVLLGILGEQGYEFVQDMADADVVLINTCTFIGDASEEAMEAIQEAQECKRRGDIRGIVVAGCMSERMRDGLRKAAPDVDALIGTAGYKDVVEAVRAAMAGRPLSRFSSMELAQPFEKRILTTLPPTAYVKIAEGCDNGCTFCVIPSIRGRFQSRPVEDIHREVASLAQRGYQEIVLVAQDTSRYGRDLDGEASLAALLEDLAAIGGVRWLRVLYTYPEGVTDDLLSVMAAHDNIAKYLDVPMQHMDDGVLRRMNRGTTGERNLALAERIRAAHPDFVVRSTFIVGFPGETRAEFETLMEGVAKARLDHVGAFPYSRERGTAAASMPGQVPEDVKLERLARLMELQRSISRRNLERRVGRELEVLVEGHVEDLGLWQARSWAEAPDVDGCVLVRSVGPLTPGTFMRARIRQTGEYDCLADAVGQEAAR